MSSVFSVLSFSVLLGATTAHLCMMQPMQRGTVNIAGPGENVCYKKVGPCGTNSVSPSDTVTQMRAGTNYTVHFQQNLNHYYTEIPGYLDVSIAKSYSPQESDFTYLAKIHDYNAMNEITQTNFTANVAIPADYTCDQCVMRVRYVSNNPLEDDRGEIFYQCANVKITSNDDGSVPPPEENEAPVYLQELSPRAPNSHDCCAPKSFNTTFTHVIPDVNFQSRGYIVYDADLQMMKVEEIAGTGKETTTVNGHFIMWMNFSNGMEYYFNVNAKTCDLYGLDYWNDWCFGDTYNQTESYSASNAQCQGYSGQTCNQWKNGDFLFEATMKDCLPSQLLREHSKEQRVYSNAKMGPFPANTFVPDSICNKKARMVHEHPRSKSRWSN